MANWWSITDRIFEFIELEDDKRPTYNKVTKETALYYKVDRTLFRISNVEGITDDIFVFEENEDVAFTLYSLFHECWHAKQKSIGIHIKYSDEDREKYVGKKHMMMLYKYDFEAQASGYAAAFVYELYTLVSCLSNCNIRLIDDSYTNIQDYPEDQFDTKSDYLAINEKIKKYYDEGKKYFEDMMDNSISPSILQLIKSLPQIDSSKSRLFSQKGSILSDINTFLK